MTTKWNLEEGKKLFLGYTKKIPYNSHLHLRENKEGISNKVEGNN